MAMYTGLRRGELLGLEWKDFDWENRLMTISRTSMWTKEKGLYTDTPKTMSSRRTLKIPVVLIDLLHRYKTYQDKYKEDLGSKWIETDRLFTQWNGKPMDVTAPHSYFKSFCERTGMRCVSNHSWRHFNASILISNGVDVKTVQSCLGHSTPTTTLQVYAHAFQTQQAMAMDAVADTINLKMGG